MSLTQLQPPVQGRTGPETVPAIEGRSQWRLAWRRLRHDRAAMAGAVVIVLMAVLAIAAPAFAALTGHAPNQQFPNTGISATGQPAGPGHAFWLGADELGRDLFVRILYGARISLFVGVLTTAIATVLGVSAGLAAGYFGGWTDMVLSRLVDAVLAFPYIVLALALAAVLGPSLPVVIGVITFFTWSGIARVVRGQTISIREREYIEAARSLGAGPLRIMFGEIFPNLLGPVLVLATLSIPSAIIFEATLSYLGLGVQPPTASWGNILAGAQNYYSVAWWYLVFPALALLITTLAFNLFGDGIRDALDPGTERLLAGAGGRKRRRRWLRRRAGAGPSRGAARRPPPVTAGTSITLPATQPPAVPEPAAGRPGKTSAPDAGAGPAAGAAPAAVGARAVAGPGAGPVPDATGTPANATGAPADATRTTTPGRPRLAGLFRWPARRLRGWSAMLVFLTRRILAGIVVLWVVTLGTFLLFFTRPAVSVARSMAGKEPTAAELRQITKDLGLNQPVIVQYGHFLDRLVHGNLGYSYATGEPVTTILSQDLPRTASLVAGAVVLWLAVGLSVGVLSATRARSLFDRTATVGVLAGLSLPTFVLGQLLLLGVFLQLNKHGFTWVQDGYESPAQSVTGWAGHMILPWITLATVSAAVYTRLTRGSMLETLSEDYIRTARAKGLAERLVITRHAMRSALTPVVSQLGIDVGTLLGGVVVVESVFGIGGIGQDSVEAVVSGNLPVIIGFVLVAAVFVVAANIVVDFCYTLLDPRVRLS
jgi:peptide/nickel transport system permease protein